jgi:hypothetical protein
MFQFSKGYSRKKMYGGVNLKDKTTHEDPNNISQKILKRHSNKYMVHTALKFRFIIQRI